MSHGFRGRGAAAEVVPARHGVPPLPKTTYLHTHLSQEDLTSGNRSGADWVSAQLTN